MLVKTLLHCYSYCSNIFLLYSIPCYIFLSILSPKRPKPSPLSWFRPQSRHGVSGQARQIAARIFIYGSTIWQTCRLCVFWWFEVFLCIEVNKLHVCRHEKRKMKQNDMHQYAHTKKLNVKMANDIWNWLIIQDFHQYLHRKAHVYVNVYVNLQYPHE